MAERGKDFISHYPHMMNLWSSLNILNPFTQSAGSAKKALWQCSLGHIWEARILNVKNGSHCNICANKKLLQGFNDLETSYPEIAKLYDNNLNKIPASEVLKGSTKSYWFKCLKYSHSYLSTVASMKEGKKCSYCSGKKLLQGFNDLPTTSSFLLSWWDYDKNNELPDQFFKSSHKKVWWKCSDGHTFLKSINEMSANAVCGYCTNRLVLSGYNDLATLSPEFLQFWDFDKNAFSPSSIFSNSHKKFWARCSHDHSWLTSPDKMSAGYRCPYCSGNSVLIGFNDLATTKPEFLSLWNLEKNTLSPTEVTSGSKKKVWWKCSKEHEWIASIYDVTSQKSNCPYCAKNISKFETEVNTFICSLGLSTRTNDRHIIAPKEIDIVVETKKIGIECNGIYWHSDEVIKKSKNMPAKDYHELKQRLAKNAGYNLFFVWEDDWNQHKNDVKKELINIVHEKYNAITLLKRLDSNE